MWAKLDRLVLDELGSRCGHEDDRGQHLTALSPTMSTTLRAFRSRWNDPLEQLPQVFWRRPFDKRSGHRLRLPQDHAN